MQQLDLFRLLDANSYPGRGIVLGRSNDNQSAVIAYFIMGRSENSRNRVFTETPDGIRTEAFDPSKMTDPSLIIYHPVRVFDGKTIVTNGNQTDTIRDGFEKGHTYQHALLTREFEPDAPNFTPRISGIVRPDGGYSLSILKSANGNPACCCRYFYEYDRPIAGQGHFIHTYLGDGTPLPSFEGEPVLVAMGNDSAAAFADRLWSALNSENKVSLFVRIINLKNGRGDTAIINQNR
ncbi:MAG: hypothetical protein H6Q60_995 [Oscillospiraceae bacterium]|nr:hypothetical protein [Oscillospiraceae bacterium]